MIRKILAISIMALMGAACAEETVSIYQLDGSIHCQSVEVTTPAQATETLEQAGVKVIASDIRTVPFSVSDACGTPTGKAIVLVVDAGDWNEMRRRRPDAHGFGVWVFDRPEIEVFKYDGSLQCQRGKEISLDDMAKELTENRIEVKTSRKGNDGRMRIAMCGASTGQLNVYSIATENLGRARELGFEMLVTGQMSNEISGSSIRRGPAMSRTPPGATGTAAGQAIPKLW